MRRGRIGGEEAVDDLWSVHVRPSAAKGAWEVIVLPLAKLKSMSEQGPVVACLETILVLSPLLGEWHANLGDPFLRPEAHKLREYPRGPWRRGELDVNEAGDGDG